MAHPTLMLPSETALLVVDVQEKLMVKIPVGLESALVRDIAFLIDAAKLSASRSWQPSSTRAVRADGRALAERLPARRTSSRSVAVRSPA